MLSGLVEGIRELTRGQDRPPTLILAGDVLDLALSLDEVCSTVYRLFAHIAFGGEPAFEPLIHYVPGNHDHHQWKVTRESQYTTYVAAQSPPTRPWSPPGTRPTWAGPARSEPTWA